MVAPDTNERIGRLEIAVEGFHDEFDEIKGAIRGFNQALSALSDRMATSREAKWGTVIQALGVFFAVLAAVWGLAVLPISDKIADLREDKKTMAEAVLIQNTKTSELHNQIHEMATRMQVLDRDLTKITNFDTPISDKRLSIIEFRLNQMAPAKTTNQP